MSDEPQQPEQPEQPQQPEQPPQPPEPPASGGRSPMLYVLAGLAAGLAVALVVVVMLVMRDDGGEPAPSIVAEPSVALSLEPSIAPSPDPTTLPTIDPIEEPTETQVKLPPVSKARVDGLYDGKYDFSFKANCKNGPCGGFAQSGARFQIPYNGSSSYRGHSTLRDTCADGGVHVQAPYKVDLAFHPTDATLIGDDWMATKVDITLTISRNAVVKKVRTSPTIITTLTCDAYKKTDRFTAVRAPF